MLKMVMMKVRIVMSDSDELRTMIVKSVHRNIWHQHTTDLILASMYHS